jgi:hypothetical protein
MLFRFENKILHQPENRLTIKLEMIAIKSRGCSMADLFALQQG